MRKFDILHDALFYEFKNSTHKCSLKLVMTHMSHGYHDMKVKVEDVFYRNYFAANLVFVKLLCSGDISNSHCSPIPSECCSHSTVFLLTRCSHSSPQSALFKMDTSTTSQTLSLSTHPLQMAPWIQHRF